MSQAIWNAGSAAPPSSNGIVVNGVLADSLVTDFGGQAAAASISADWILCIDGIYFDAVAAVAVRIFLAPVAGDTEDDIQDLLNSATVGSDVQHWVGPSFNVPRVEILSGVWQPHTLRITKADGNAKVRVHWSWRPPGSC
jgi:hypothetical protein